ncbi:MAG: ClC family H(+)/Cl(-) exchange transporter [Mobilitalea sp.]
MTKVFKILSSLNQLRWKIAIKGILCGLLAGLLVSFYRLCIEYGTEKSLLIYSFLKKNPIAILPWLIIAMFLAWFLYRLIKLEPLATGSGIPQVEGILLYGMKMKWYTILLVRYVGGIIASFFGLSLGREGPSIQIGASASQAIAPGISSNKLEENYLITGGAAAGLSAAFNAPLSGIMFALEEVHRSFSPLVLIAATTASLVADLVSKYFFGLKPVLDFMTIPQMTERVYFWLIPIGLFSGLIGSLTNKSLLKFQQLYDKVPIYLRPFIAFLIALPFGLVLPQVLGGGQNLIQLSEQGNLSVDMLLILLGGKLIFTCICFGSGVPGGIFLPILSVGALSGSLVGLFAEQFGLPSSYIPTFAICAMAGALSGSVKAPITSILLTAEMTGSLVHLLPVAICSFIAMFLSDILKTTPIYEALLERIANKNKVDIKKNKQGILIEVPVEVGSEACGKKISEISWPANSLIVGIHRGNRDLVPNGSTRMMPGDYLIVLAAEQALMDINTQIKALCYIKSL